MASAQGQNGQVHVDQGWLTITRGGLGRVGHSKGDRRIPLGSITAVQMRPAGRLSNGFIKFTVPGSPELRGGLTEAGRDENAVIFTRKQQDQFDAVRQAVESYIGQRAAGVPQQTVAPDLAAQLAQLGQLHQSGALSLAEYQAAKARLLG